MNEIGNLFKKDDKSSSECDKLSFRYHKRNCANYKEPYYTVTERTPYVHRCEKFLIKKEGLANCLGCVRNTIDKS